MRGALISEEDSHHPLSDPGLKPMAGKPQPSSKGSYDGGSSGVRKDPGSGSGRDGLGVLSESH